MGALNNMKLKFLKSHPYNKSVFREITGNEYESFKNNIKEKGILIPIEITSKNVILCGHQRTRALTELYGGDYDLDDSKIIIRKDLESDDIEMTDILQKMRVIEDNQLRRHLNEAEMIFIYEEKLVMEKKLAERRYKENVGRPNKSEENVPQNKEDREPQSRDKAAEGLNLSGKTLEKYSKMMKIATEKEKEIFLKTGKIPDSLKERFKIKQQEESRKKAEESDKLRKAKAEKEKQQKLKEEQKKKKKLEEKIRNEKIEKEEAERLRREAEEAKKKEEEQLEKIKVHYQSSEKMKELDNSIGLIVTSPPYWKIKEYGQGESEWSYNDYLISMKKVWKECFRVLKPSSKLCINIGDQYMNAKEHGKFEVIPIHADFIKQCKELGFDYYGMIIWQKASTMNSSGGGTFLGSYPYPKNGMVLFDFEFILLFHKPGESEKPEKDIKESSLISQTEWQKYFSSHWNFVGERQKDHPAQFPEELPRRLIKMYSFKDETVLDPFLGSGTTLKVAKELERQGIGYEINKKEFEALINKKIYSE